MLTLPRGCNAGLLVSELSAHLFNRQGHRDFRKGSKESARKCGLTANLGDLDEIFDQFNHWSLSETLAPIAVNKTQVVRHKTMDKKPAKYF